MPSTRTGARPDAGVHACTIIARNYLPAARTLATSFAAIHPDGTFSVLVLDDVHGVVDAAAEPFEVLHLHDLNEDIGEIHHMAAIYDVMEFATSVKPWLLETLLDRGWDSVLYIDPDIEIYDRLDELTRQAVERGIVLTPHARAPYPRDGLKTDETSILAAGVYNLGFIGVGKRAAPFLSFWKERLRRECLTDPVHMRFVDQRWVDFVPSMFDCAIVRDPRWNVAYWNLHERDLTWTGERYEVDGASLGFFHFSGYSPARPHVLSKHQGDRPRILFSDRPAVARICKTYGETLIANGFGSPTPGGERYGFDQAVNGVPLDEYIRDLYLSRLLDSDQMKADPPPDPFEPDGAAELLE